MYRAGYPPKVRSFGILPPIKQGGPNPPAPSGPGSAGDLGGGRLRVAHGLRRAARGPLKGSGVLLKDPGVFLKDPGVLLKDPGVL